MAFRSRRLEDLFGGLLSDIGYADLLRLINNRDAAEAEDLDYKRAHYTSSPESREELAKDVAAFANHLGGVIVIGFAENGGIPSKEFDVDLDDAHLRELRSRIASTTAPPVHWEPYTKENPAAPGRGFLLLAVPRSPHTPHAVTAPPVKATSAALRYPRRSGSQTDWLTETNVATAYRERFRAADDRRQRMRDIQEDLVPDEVDRSLPHLLVTVVPDVPGEMPINQRAYAAHTKKLLAMRHVLGSLQPAFLHVSLGSRRLELDWPGSRNNHDLAHLYDDGSGIWAHPIRDSRVWTTDDGDDMRVLSAYRLVHQLMSALAFLGAHARDRCGATGTANIEVDLVDEMSSHPYAPPGRSFRQDASTPLVLEQNPAPPNGSVAVNYAQAEATALLDDLADERTGLVQATSALADRLFHAFGIPEAFSVTAQGEIRRAHWSGDSGHAVLAWANVRSIPIVSPPDGTEPTNSQFP